MTTIQSYIAANRQRFIDELIEFLRIPSVSADSRYKQDVARAAEFVRHRLEESGAEHAEVIATQGHPIVYADKIVNPAWPTVLVYGHYDVQPPDPIELWDSPPFEPVIKDEKIYARGACDDKGQVYMHIKAFELMMRTRSLPCNVKFLIEGEEEVGADNLNRYVENNREKLVADVILISDTDIIANDVPAITVGLRGLSYVEIEVTGPKRDLHSGMYGGAVANPAIVLCEMISALFDQNRRITIPGFYDDVKELSQADREELARAPFSLEQYKKELGISDVLGEKDYSSMERSSIRPTLEVNGIWSGYTGEGAKTIIPSKAFAKISMRLVPNQDPDKITQLFVRHLEAMAPKYVSVKVKPDHGAEPVVIPSDSIAFRAASAAMEETFGKKPVPIRSGGSIPIVAFFEEALGLKSVLMGFGLDTDNIHSPNEHFGLYNYFKGIETIPLFYKHFAAMKGNAEC